MLRNNNQTAVKRLGIRALKQNKTRNLFTILAIVLTTFMFTTVFSIGFSMGKNLSVMMLRQQGSKTSITLEQPEKKQVEQAKQAKYLEAAGIKIPVGIFHDTKEDADLLLDYYDHTEFEKNFRPAISHVVGEYPSRDNEVMLSKAALDAMKIKHPVKGMELELTDGARNTTFSLCGWFTDYSYSAGGFHGLLSKKYVERWGLTQEKDGVLCLSARTGKQGALLEELEESVSLRKGQEWESSYDVQEENRDNVAVIAVTIGLLGLIILLSGYLLIYNVMYISVTKDIRFYGMLKTIGTSPSQIKRIVKMQTTKLSVIGIPIGMAMGTIVSFVAVPMAMKLFSAGQDGAMPSDISFHPFVYLGTVLFALVTVAVSCRKPAKLASKVSAVEAMKYQGQQESGRKARHSTNGGKIYKMAFRNVFRQKKRTFLVFASLFMGTMAFLSVDTFLGSLKVENYVKYYLPHDFNIYLESTESEGDGESAAESARQLIKDITQIEGVTSVSVNRSADAILDFDEDTFLPFLKEEFPEPEKLQEAVAHYQTTTDEESMYSSPVIAVSSDILKEYNRKARQKIDLERFAKGEICLMGYVQSMKDSEQLLGKKISITDKESRKTISLEVGACPMNEEDYGLEIGYYWMKAGAPSCILISDKAMDSLCREPSIDNIIVDCEPKAESSVKAQMKQMTKINPLVVHTEIRSDMSREFQSSMTAMNILCGGISIILILIGVLNFINVMLTGVYTRRSELAVMESVGMTKRQVKRMLSCEGIYYGLITMVLILTIGNAIIYQIARMATMLADYAVFHYPAPLLCVIAIVIMSICILVPSVVYHMISRESITQRLRMGE